MSDSITEASELARRIAELEKAAPSHRESRFLRFGALAGVIGTIISILNGGLTVYSETLRKTEEDRQTLYTQFSARIDEIIADNQKLMTLAVSKEEQPGSRMATASTINSAKFYTLNAARAMLPRVDRMVTAPQFVLLATETAQAGDIVAGREYMVRAVQISDGPMKAEVLRMEGRMFMLSNDASDRAKALAAFAQAADLAEPASNWGASYNKSTILHDWIIANVIAGNCHEAAGLIPRLAAMLPKPDMTPEARTYVKLDLRKMLAQQPGCKVDTSPLGP